MPTECSNIRMKPVRWSISDFVMRTPAITRRQKQALGDAYRRIETNLSTITSTFMISPEVLHKLQAEGFDLNTPGLKTIITPGALKDAHEALYFSPTADLEFRLAGKKQELFKAQDHLEEALHDTNRLQKELADLEIETKTGRKALVKEQHLSRDLKLELLKQGQELLELRELVAEYRELQKQWEPPEKPHRTLDL